MQFKATASGQIGGPFLWSDGCYTPNGGPNQSDVPPDMALSFAPNETNLWYGAAVLGSTEYVTRRTDDAMFWIVPRGGHATVPPKKLTRFIAQVLDSDHWLWTTGTSTDSFGRAMWDENFGGGLGVGRVRVYKGLY